METSYVTTRGRRLGSIVVGVVLGGLASAVPTVLILSENGKPSVESVSLGVVGSLIGWLVGIVVLGLPVWLICERQKQGPSRRSALLCGAILPPLWFFALVALTDILLPRRSGASDSPSAVWIPVFAAVPFALLGLGVGLAMWRFAYRREIKLNIADTFS